MLMTMRVALLTEWSITLEADQTGNKLRDEVTCFVRSQTAEWSSPGPPGSKAPLAGVTTRLILPGTGPVCTCSLT